MLEQPGNKDFFHQIRLVAVHSFLGTDTQGITPPGNVHLDNRIDIAKEDIRNLQWLAWS
jgi:hypothetical protein